MIMQPGGSLAFFNLKSSEEDDEPKSAIAIWLEETCRRMVAKLGTREWSDPLLDLIVPNFTAYMEHSDQPYVNDREEFFAVYDRMAERSPDYKFEVLNASAVVDEKKGKATVWLVLRILGDPKDTERESVTLASWRRSSGKWLCHSQTGVRGVAVY